MRILSVHNKYQIRGGEDESREAEQRLLQEMGHEVAVYEETNDKVAALNPAQLALRTVWSNEAYSTIRQFLREKPCQIVHIQNFFPLLSPSIHHAAQAEGVPVVQTLRNYRLLCPNALFFRDGRVCEDCLGQFVPVSGIVHGCYRDSKVASTAVATMLTTHRLLQTWTEKVDLYIALTEFARSKFIAGGVPAERIVVKPNFVHPDPGVGEGKGNYALFVGRLSIEKGLDTLLAAWEKLDNRIPLKIVGEGPLADQVAKAIARSPHIEWLGRKPMPEVHRLMGEAQFLVFPSKWYETFGRVAIEAFAKGTPVVASDIGAIAELVDDRRTGLKFRPGDPDDLRTQVEWLLSHPHERSEMRRAVRAEFETRYTAEKNYQQLIEIYHMAQLVHSKR